VELPRPAKTSRFVTIRRRLLFISGQFVLGILLLLVLPGALLLALIVDVALRRWGLGTVRFVLMALAFLWIEIVCHLWAFGSWVRFGFGTKIWTSAGQRSANATVSFWIVSMMWALRILGARFVYVGDPAPPTGPVIAAARHQSFADVYMPTRYLLDSGRDIRVVLASQLRNEPALDVVGHRTPQFFVKRDGADMRREVEGISRMTQATADNTGFCIFPEGGLARPKRRARIIERLDKGRPDLAARARALEHLLAPRVAGLSAMLDGAPTAPVVITGHVGFEQLTAPKTAWRAVPLKHQIEIRTWHHERSAIPDDPAERELWLFDQWETMDHWIDERMQARNNNQSSTLKETTETSK